MPAAVSGSGTGASRRKWERTCHVSRVRSHRASMRRAAMLPPPCSADTNSRTHARTRTHAHAHTGCTCRDADTGRQAGRQANLAHVRPAHTHSARRRQRSDSASAGAACVARHSPPTLPRLLPAQPSLIRAVALASARRSRGSELAPKPQPPRAPTVCCVGPSAAVASRRRRTAPSKAGAAQYS